MGEFIGNIVEHALSIEWEGPAMFGVVLLAFFAIFRQWRVLLLTLLTLTLGWGAGDLMVFNIQTSSNVMSVSLMVYCAGGAVCLALAIVSFLKMAL